MKINTMDEFLQFQIQRRIDDVIYFASQDSSVDRLRSDLTDLISKTYDEKSKKAIGQALRKIEQLPEKGILQKKEADLILLELESYLGEPLAAAIEAPIINLTQPLYSAGLLQAGEQAGANLKLLVPDFDAINLIGKQNLFWVGDHWNNDLSRQFNDILTPYFEKGLTRKQLADELEKVFFDIAKKDRAYWENMADHMSTKSAELGRIAGYKRAGVKEVRVRSRLAHNTCEFCVDMNGRIVSVEHLEAQMQNILSATSVEGLKDAHPWQSKAINKKSSSLAADVGSPPYHGKCYCTTEAYFRELEEPVHITRGSRIPKDDLPILNKFTPSEYAIKLKDMQRVGSSGKFVTSKVSRTRTGRARGVEFQFFDSKKTAQKAAKDGFLFEMPKSFSKPLVRLDAKLLKIHDEKLLKYALDPTHPRGKHKAKVFDQVLGYNQNNWNELKSELLKKIPKENIAKTVYSEKGFRYATKTSITGPSGRSADVLTVWRNEGDSYRLVSTRVVKKSGGK